MARPRGVSTKSASTPYRALTSAGGIEYRSQFLELFRMKGLKVLEEDKKYER